MRARCPNNEEHDRFMTVAHISQDWEVDAEGEFIKVIGDGEIVASPRSDNIWTCSICGAEAEVTDE